MNRTTVVVLTSSLLCAAGSRAGAQLPKAAEPEPSAAFAGKVRHRTSIPGPVLMGSGAHAPGTMTLRARFDGESDGFVQLSTEIPRDVRALVARRNKVPLAAIPRWTARRALLSTVPGFAPGEHVGEMVEARLRVNELGHVTCVGLRLAPERDR